MGRGERGPEEFKQFFSEKIPLERNALFQLEMIFMEKISPGSRGLIPGPALNRGPFSKQMPIGPLPMTACYLSWILSKGMGCCVFVKPTCMFFILTLQSMGCKGGKKYPPDQTLGSEQSKRHSLRVRCLQCEPTSEALSVQAIYSDSSPQGSCIPANSCRD